MANIILKLSGVLSASIVKASLKSDKRSYLPAFLSGLVEAMGALPKASVQILNDDSASAQGIITILDYTKMTDGDTYQIGSLILTAKTSGASTNEFNIGASNAASAVNLAAAISAYSLGAYASSSGAIVTVIARISGIMGNQIPLIITQGTPGSASSDAALSGGLEDSALKVDYRSF